MTAPRPDPAVAEPAAAPAAPEVAALAAAALDAFRERRQGADGPALDLDPDQVAQDVARLALALMEFLRQLLEAQAIRRMERGALTPDEEERVGLALMRARARLVEVAAEFGLPEDALTLDLGPLGKLC